MLYRIQNKHAAAIRGWLTTNEHVAASYGVGGAGGWCVLVWVDEMPISVIESKGLKELTLVQYIMA